MTTHATQLDLFDPALTHPPASARRRRRPRARRTPRRNELLEVARVALLVARRELNDYSCPKSKHTFTQPQLLACLVLRAYRKLTYRGTSELLDASDALREVLGLTHAPAHTTFKEFERRAVTPTLLDRLVGAVLALLVEAGVVVTEVAVDSTGVETSGASAHFRTRAKRERKGYVKLSMCVACTSILLVSLAVSMGPSNDLGDGAREVLWRAAGRCRPDWWLADAAFDAEWFHTFCAASACGASSHVPPVPKARDGTVKSGPDRVRCATHTPLNYGRRWHVESFISGLKRTCGSTLAARSERALFNEAGLKALAYAVRR